MPPIRIQSGCCDKHLSEMAKRLLEAGSAIGVEMKFEIVEAEEGSGVDLLAKTVVFRKAQSCNGGSFLPFAGVEAGGLIVEVERKVVAMGACESKAEMRFARAVFVKLGEVVGGVERLRGRVLKHDGL